MPNETPTVVIVGRPNVGKSTLFNRITGQRRSIVGDEPGITRDRIPAPPMHEGRRFELIDTGGIVVNDAEYIPSQILKQAQCRAGAGVPCHLSRGRPRRDHRLRPRTGRNAAQTRQAGLAGRQQSRHRRQNEDLVHDFYSLGIKDIFPVSSEHGIGMDALLDHVTEGFPCRKTTEEPAAGPPNRAIKVAIIGRPNVGKSTLLNALTGEERAIVSPIAGTTRDAVDETVERDGTNFVFIDTAGIRRKGKTKADGGEAQRGDGAPPYPPGGVVIVVMDASEGFVGLDATIAGYAHEGGRPVILCVKNGT